MNSSVGAFPATSATAATAGDWSKYVWLHERPHRLDALLRARDGGLASTPTEYRALVGEVWRDSESIRQLLPKWKRVWGTEIEGRTACMSPEDIRIFDSLPREIEVWRGTSYKASARGVSWTIDQERAAWFARRFSFGSRTPLVARGVVNKDDVLAYFGERGQSEIVSTRVSIIERSPIPE